MLAHLDDEDAGLAAQTAPAKGVAQQVRHLRRKLDAARACADDDEGRGAAGILRRGIGRDSVERGDHPATQIVRVPNLAKRKGVLFGALDAPEVRHAADGQHQIVVTETADAARHLHLAALEVDADGRADDESHAVVEQLLIVRRDVPSLDLAAQVFVEQRGMQEMVFV
jgi:hypothetical protein